MKYKDKINFCKSVNNDPIYQEYSFGVRCCCFRDTHGRERLQVMHLGCHKQLFSTICNLWEEDFMLEWIMHATQVLKDDLGLGVSLMIGVDFSAVAIVHGKYHVIEDSCLVGSDDPVRIQNAVKYYLREEKSAELVKLIKADPF